jgi:alanine-glyoxylate transaminase / serine-glyoxylate transaminase / serine-pyruvate transaminase
MEVPKPEVFKTPLLVVEKTMTGPGPSNYPQRVRNALSLPIMGQLHSETFKIMDDIKEGIKYLFQTKNSLTFCISGPGHAGLECALANLIEDNDVVLIATQGIWGQRAENIAKRLNGDIKILKKLPGEQVSVEEVRESFQKYRPKIFFIAHGESSTGMMQQHLGAFGDLCREFECLFVVDAVITLGCVPFYADTYKIDVAYSGTQKVLNAPPGITPITFSERAL